MSKSYKKKKEIEEVIIDNDNLSKKEQYDLEKKNKLKLLYIQADSQFTTKGEA